MLPSKQYWGDIFTVLTQSDNASSLFRTLAPKETSQVRNVDVLKENTRQAEAKRNMGLLSGAWGAVVLLRETAYRCRMYSGL